MYGIMIKLESHDHKKIFNNFQICIKLTQYLQQASHSLEVGPPPPPLLSEDLRGS